MNTTRAASHTNLWWQWAIATVTGFVVGGILGGGAGFIGLSWLGNVFVWIGLCPNNQGAITCFLLASVLAAAITLGSVVGVAQWWVLRRFIRRSKGWILASALGWPGVAVTMTVLAYMGIPAPIANPDGTFSQRTILDNAESIILAVSALLLTAAFLGFLQWLVLRLSLRSAVWWVLMNSLVWLIGSAIMVLVVRGGGGLLGVGFFFVGFSPVYAVISGIVLGKLISFRQV
jgi:hypothetical protein